jgi:hypothetical protein
MEMKHKLVELFCNKWADRDRDYTGIYTNLAIRDEDFQRVKMQLLALGLIMKLVDTGYWKLTPWGLHQLTQVAAIPAQKERSDQ